jgi:hypothetical protein
MKRAMVVMFRRIKRIRSTWLSWAHRLSELQAVSDMILHDIYGVRHEVTGKYDASQLMSRRERKDRTDRE